MISLLQVLILMLKSEERHEIKFAKESLIGLCSCLRLSDALIRIFKLNVNIWPSNLHFFCFFFYDTDLMKFGL